MRLFDTDLNIYLRRCGEKDFTWINVMNFAAKTHFMAGQYVTQS